MNGLQIRLSALTIVALCLLVLAACGGNNAASPSERGATGDPEGAGDARGEITVSIYDRGEVSSGEGTYDDNRWTRWINENGPHDVQFEVIPRWESQQKYSVLFAAGTAPDLILEFDNAFRTQLWGQKQLLPLDDLIEEHSTEYKELLAQFPELRKLGTKSDGQLYDIGFVRRPEVLGTIVIRQDWLDKLGLDVPETMEELYEVAYAFAHEDPDENGVKDTFGINLSQFAHFYIDGMFGNEMFVLEDGELVRQFDRIEPAIDFKKRLFDNDIVDKDFLTDENGQKAAQDFVNGKLGIFISYKSVLQSHYELLKANEPDAVVTAIPFPASDYGSFGPDIHSPLQMVGSVNAGADNPAAVIDYIDFMLQEETVKQFEYGDEGEHYELDENGCYQRLDPDKFQSEVHYNRDYKMFMTRYWLPQCAKDGIPLDTDDPIEQEWLALAEEMDRLYLDPERMKEGFTHPDTRPSLSREHNQTFDTGWTQMNEFVVKAVVSGASYSSADALEDIRQAWYNSGGQELEDWYQEWYAENHDKWVFMEDIYRMEVE